MKRYLAASLSSALMLSTGWLMVTGVPLLVALVPLLWISGRADGSRRAFWRVFGWTALALGLWSGVNTWWIWKIAPAGAVLSVVITVTLMGVPLMLYHYTSKRAHKVLAYTILVSGWIACEYLYTVGEVSFPWLMLGNGFMNDVRLVQWYEATGLFGGTLWVLLCNVLFHEALTLRGRSRWIYAAAAALAPALVSIAMFAGYGESGERVAVSVVQPNIDPLADKFRISQDEQTAILTDLAAAAPADTRFVVMPETAVDDRLWEGGLDHASPIEQLRGVVGDRCPGGQIIVGATTFRRYAPGENISRTARNQRGTDFWYDIYNSALAVDTAGTVQIHHKSLLVIGAEKMPRWLPERLDELILDLGGTTGQLGVDSVQRVFDAPSGTRTAAAICYESVYGAYFSRFTAGGAQLMFVITNDGWWGDTHGHRHHFAYSRLRAIESRRAIARSANTGISGFITPRGEVMETLGWDVRGVITQELPLNDRVTFYARSGDYIARICIYLFILSMLYYPAYRMRRRDHLVK